jgi:hypothetical protein
MALIWVKSTPATPETVKGGFSWDAWYEKNKTRLAEKRAKRYREDPSYRKAALERSRHQRTIKKEPVTDGHTVGFNDAAYELNVTVWVLREWRKKNYYPEPYHREGRLWFSPHQVQLLRQLQQFFDQHGSRVSDAIRTNLDDTVSLIYSNW